MRDRHLHQRPRGQYQQPGGRGPSSAGAVRRRRIRSRSTTGSANDEPADYLRTAEALRRCVDVVSIQHEYGIWGGEDGASRPRLRSGAQDPFGHHASHRPAAPDTGSAGRPLRARGQDGRNRRHVAIGGRSADKRIRCRPEPCPRHSARRTGTAVRRSGHGQASPGPGRSQGHPELRPAWSGQGIRARARRRCPTWSRRIHRCCTSSSVRPTRTSFGARARPTARAWSRP